MEYMEVRQFLENLLHDVELIPVTTGAADDATTKEERLETMLDQEAEARETVAKKIKETISSIDDRWFQIPNPDRHNLRLALNWVSHLMEGRLSALDALNLLSTSHNDTLTPEHRRYINQAINALSSWEPPHMWQDRS